MLGALPTKELLVKSAETRKFPERRHINIVKEIPVVKRKKLDCYKDFSMFEKRTSKVKQLGGWNIDESQ